MTVSEQIIQVLNALCEKFGLVIDWTSENIVPHVTTLLGKLVIWEIWSSVAWMGIMLLLCLLSFVGIKKFTPVFKNGLERDRRVYDIGWSIASTFAVIGLCVLYLATIIVIGNQIIDIIKCVTFPEMFIFEYVQGVINSGSGT